MTTNQPPIAMIASRCPLCASYAAGQISGNAHSGWRASGCWHFRLDLGFRSPHTPTAVCSVCNALLGPDTVRLKLLNSCAQADDNNPALQRYLEEYDWQQRFYHQRTP